VVDWEKRGVGATEKRGMVIRSIMITVSDVPLFQGDLNEATI
jgi:hypothetical protein